MGKETHRTLRYVNRPPCRATQEEAENFGWRPNELDGQSISPRFFAGHGMPCPYGKKLAAEGDAARDDCCHWGAAKGATVKRGVAGFAGGFGCAKSPFVIGRENCEVGGLTGGAVKG